MQTEVHRTGTDYTGRKRRKRRLGADYRGQHPLRRHLRARVVSDRRLEALRRYARPADEQILAVMFPQQCQHGVLWNWLTD
jgi:hypothetical protein